MPQHAQAASPSLVPELLITDLSTSLRFWVDICGFEVLYDRPDEGFAYLHLGSAHVMLDQIGMGRDWVTGSLERPLGRGVNFEIAVPSLDELLARCAAAEWPLFLEPETRWYGTADGDVGVRQFLVQDPDGYLLRFTSRVTSAAGCITSLNLATSPCPTGTTDLASLTWHR